MISNLVKAVKSRKPKKILLQLPDGLRMKALEIANELEKSGIAVIVSGEPCYGACDLRDDEARKAKCDMLVHVGHIKFYKKIKTKIPVLYYPWAIAGDISGVDFSAIKEKRIGLLTTVQHMESIKEVAKKLEKIGKKAVVGGHVLGCWTQNAEKIKSKVDAFLFIGSGRFHALGVKGKVYCLDVEKKKIESVDNMLFEKKRYARIFKAKDAAIFAILVSTKQGQFDLKKAEAIKKCLEKRDKKAFILIMDEITDEKLLGIKADMFINTACPRLFDAMNVLNAEDVDEIWK
ncbi:MAG: diphthamide biosynthesis enzyme Dph2 [Candidatus Aenigmatarchaeota archaeon]